MDRRAFLAAAAAPLLEPPPIRIGFLGGSHPHTPPKVETVRESPLWELAGIAEEDAATRAAYEKAGVQALPRERLLADRSVRVISVGSANAHHARDARQALEAGKHVHLEKPPATSLDEIRALLELARRKALLVQPGYMWRYNPGIRAALEAARAGWLGEIYLVRGAINTTGSPEERRQWAAFPGGMMFELGCHLLDPAVRLLGRPSGVTPFLRRDGGDELADNTLAVLEFPRAMAVIGSAARDPNAARRRFFEILGTNGTAVVRPIEPPALEIDLRQAAGPFRVGRQAVAMPAYRRYVDDYAALAAAVAHGGPLAVSPREELLVHETLMRACRM